MLQVFRNSDENERQLLGFVESSGLKLKDIPDHFSKLYL
jgi:hypothetical protein